MAIFQSIMKYKNIIILATVFSEILFICATLILWIQNRYKMANSVRSFSFLFYYPLLVLSHLGIMRSLWPEINDRPFAVELLTWLPVILIGCIWVRVIVECYRIAMRKTPILFAKHNLMGKIIFTLMSGFSLLVFFSNVFEIHLHGFVSKPKEPQPREGQIQPREGQEGGGGGGAEQLPGGDGVSFLPRDDEQDTEGGDEDEESDVEDDDEKGDGDSDIQGDDEEDKGGQDISISPMPLTKSQYMDIVSETLLDKIDPNDPKSPAMPLDEVMNKFIVVNVYQHTHVSRRWPMFIRLFKRKATIRHILLRFLQYLERYFDNKAYCLLRKQPPTEGEGELLDENFKVYATYEKPISEYRKKVRWTMEGLKLVKKQGKEFHWQLDKSKGTYDTQFSRWKWNDKPKSDEETFINPAITIPASLDTKIQTIIKPTVNEIAITFESLTDPYYKLTNEAMGKKVDQSLKDYFWANTTENLTLYIKSKARQDRRKKARPRIQQQ